MRNEAANVPQFYRELRSVLQRMGRPYEIIVIDDGSLDETFGRLAALQATDPSLVVIRFRRNFGQTAAFAAGFAHARGRLIVTTDGDLQNDPADIPAMIDLAEQADADIVAGWRKDRKDAFFSRRRAVDDRQLGDLTDDRRVPARLRLLAQGVPRRSREADEALRRDAPLPAGDRQRVRRDDRGVRRQSPAAAARQFEIRHLEDGAGGPRSVDGQVPDQLPHAAAADFRAAGA